MSFYSELAADAAALIEELGQAVVLTRVTPGAYDPDTGSAAPTEATQNGFAAIFAQPASAIDGVLIQAGDFALLLDAVNITVAPKIGDTVTLVSGVTLTITAINALAPAGTTVIYEGNLR